MATIEQMWDGGTFSCTDGTCGHTFLCKITLFIVMLCKWVSTQTKQLNSKCPSVHWCFSTFHFIFLITLIWGCLSPGQLWSGQCWVWSHCHNCNVEPIIFWVWSPSDDAGTAPDPLATCLHSGRPRPSGKLDCQNCRGSLVCLSACMDSTCCLLKLYCCCSENSIIDLCVGSPGADSAQATEGNEARGEVVGSVITDQLWSLKVPGVQWKHDQWWYVWLVFIFHKSQVPRARGFTRHHWDVEVLMLSLHHQSIE